ncbi:hypothetical protein HPB49_025850 [Dermacentor silvarum]|nr:hypothetical protein HPB49_025850 [Dermacentor silvarum]
MGINVLEYFKVGQTSQDADAEKQSLQSQLGELAARLADAARQMDETTEQLTKAQEEVSSLRGELLRAQEENAQLVHQLESMEKRLSDTKAELQAQVDSSKQETAALKDKKKFSEALALLFAARLLLQFYYLFTLCLDFITQKLSEKKCSDLRAHWNQVRSLHYLLHRSVSNRYGGRQPRTVARAL